ncbi:MAG: 4'-phosphopantetheinyl transferase family protein [Lachnospiraceae bacterium]
MSNKILILYEFTEQKNRTPSEYHTFQQGLSMKIVTDGFATFFHEQINETDIIKMENGKPFYEKNSDLHFNITHSRCMVAVAFSDCSIGIDAESERPVRDRTIERVCTPKEAEYVYQEAEYVYQDPAQISRRFLHIWTLKESILKETGIGLRVPLNQFSVLHALQDSVIWTQSNLDSEWRMACVEQDSTVSFLLDNWPFVLSVTAAARRGQMEIVTQEVHLA